MDSPKRTSIYAAMALVVAAVAAVALVVAVVGDVREPDDCLAVDESLVTLIATRSAAGPITPQAAVAVEDPFARSRQSVPYNDYYIVVMRFQVPDGTTVDGVWGLGTNAPKPERGRSLSQQAPVDGRASSLAALTPQAEQWTDWPNRDIPIQESDPLVQKARRCPLRQV
ncbi:hypothetical protein DFR70_1011099 [Nocardia tenerifensis]|uniref:Uncharacterized protein n=1 Tax=Nocardia tenerifensis TaxID=228006 RepID=A0A318KFC1_9NOCA|nr:hypothetical protein [Nocardia tenerifensis]PXX71665.1 hypothetical protein DFR70_1011099 [Nocardia tenerifensis]